jgi:hypothetical protein
MPGITKDNRSLTTFRRSAGGFARYTEGYQRLLDVAALVDAEEGIRQGLDDAARGRTRSAKEAFDEVRRKFGFRHTAWRKRKWRKLKRAGQRN